MSEGTDRLHDRASEHDDLAEHHRERAAEHERRAKNHRQAAADQSEVIDYELAAGGVVLQEAGSADAWIEVDPQNVWDPVEVNEFL